jgi:hypothetical protein
MPKAEETQIGRPPHFNTPEELDICIAEYFADPPTVMVLSGDKPTEVSAVTITGLAYHLGFESRQSFYDYEKRPSFSYSIKRARLRVEHGYETKLHFNNVAGPIFVLKSMGWRENDEAERMPSSFSINIVNPNA